MILVSAQVLLVLTLGLWTSDFGLGLDNKGERDADAFYKRTEQRLSRDGSLWLGLFCGVLVVLDNE